MTSNQWLSDLYICDHPQANTQLKWNLIIEMKIKRKKNDKTTIWQKANAEMHYIQCKTMELNETGESVLCVHWAV